MDFSSPEKHPDATVQNPEFRRRIIGDRPIISERTYPGAQGEELTQEIHLRHSLYVLPNRPMDMPEMLAAMLTIIRLEWRTLLSIGCSVMAVVLLFNAIAFALWSSRVQSSGLLSSHLQMVIGVLLGDPVTFLLSVVFCYPFAGSMVLQLVRQISGGHLFDWRIAFSRTFSVVLLLSGATVLSWIAGFGGMVLFTPAILMLLNLTRPIIVFEGDNVIDAMGRSWALIRRRFWPYALARMAMLGLFLGCLLVGVGVASILADLVGLFLPGFVSTLFAGTLIFGVGAFAVTIPPLMTALVYLDARMRFESFDPTAPAFIISAR